MRIAVVHSFYSSSQPSGENRVVEDQVALLRDAGHEVLLVARHTDEESERSLYAVRAAGWVATGRGGDPTAQLRAFAPDIVHVHNLFPNIGTRWMKFWEGPVVASLHNFRLLCSNGILYRDGAVCLECPSHSDVHAITHRCYRDSVMATLPLAVSRRTDRHRMLSRADAVVATSPWSQEVISRFAPPTARLTMIPNSGADDGQDPRTAHERSGWLAMGRFSAEKGFEELLEDWPTTHALEVIGDGERVDAVTAVAAARGIVIESSIPREALRERLPRYAGLVFPSRWLEVAPQVVVEAMRVGLPVVAYEANGVSQLVRSTGTGMAYGDRRSLLFALDAVRADLDAYSRRAIAHYRSAWRPSVWVDAMTGLYEQLRAGAR